jgi:predicted nucleic acid-binding protein
VLLYAHQRISERAVSILRRCAEADIIGILPSTVWEELCHRLMIAEAVATGRIAGPNPARRLAEQPEVVRDLSAYRVSLSALAAMGLRFEPVTREDVLVEAMALQRRYGLLTNDSIIAACARRLGVDRLITSDRSLTALKELSVVVVDDVNMAS